MTDAEMTKELTIADATASLLAMYDEQSIPEKESNRVHVPILHVFMGKGTKYSDRGAKDGLVIDWGEDRIDVNLSELRVSQIWWFETRIMWPYDDKGVRLQPKDKNEKLKPLCASGNGISPRKNELFGYIGSEHLDWRTPHLPPIKIVENGCATCPLGDAVWAGMYDPEGNALMGEDDKGRPKHITGAPPCSLLHAYVLWDHDRNTFMVYKAANYTADKYLMGRIPHRSNGMKGIQGISHYTKKQKNGDPPLVFGDGSPEDFHPLIVRPFDVDTSKKTVPVAKFELDDVPLTEEEYVHYNQAVNEFKNNSMYRLYVTGEIFESYDANEEVSTVSAIPF